jgi:hypothetical protein
MVEPLRNGGGIYQTFQLQLLLPELLLQLTLLSLVGAEHIEHALVSATQINRENQYGRKIKNNKSKAKWGPHSN